MATLRSSLPSRLRQLLSGEGAIGGPSIKLDSDTVSSIYTLTFSYIFIYGVFYLFIYSLFT